MLNDKPLVSILMNCYNGAQYLRAAIESVIQQTYDNWELIFWDNQSTDHSAAICQSYHDLRIKYFYSDTHTNLGGARLRAYAEAKGELIAILDTDDIWAPTKLELQVPAFQDNKIGIVISNTLFFNERGQEKVLYRKGPPEGYVFNQLIKHYFISLETVVLRRSAMESLEHVFDENMSHISDFDLIVRLAFRWKLFYVPEVLAKWRVHLTSASWVQPERFSIEKMQFMKKIEASPIADSQDWQKAKKCFMQNIAIETAKTSLLKGDTANCRISLSKLIFQNWRILALYLISFIPLSNKLLQYHQRKSSLC